MSSSCLTCSDPIAPCPSCPSGQMCVQTGRSCSACPQNSCVDDGSSSSKSGGGSSTGVTAGGAVGGVLGVAAIIAAIYFFWWRPRGLAASRRRYSKHLSHRQSKLAEKRKTQLAGAPGAAGGAAGENGVTKRTSVHLRMDPVGDGAVNRRASSPGRREDEASALTSRTSEEDNPFGDQNRSSIGTFNDGVSIHTSEFSFRSSQSTNIIPIAYIPPHSSSMSIDDAQRGAYGQLSRDPPSGPASRQAARASIPTSMASRDSLALAGAEIIELHPLPPVLTPDTPSIPIGTTANGAPIRPPRSPGLDLQLPKTDTPVTSPLNSPQPQQGSISRPVSGFPFSSAPSTSGTSSPTNQLLTPTSALHPRGVSILAERADGTRAAHLSTMSAATSRSANSTMSYILDPPQIITPVNAQGVKRVEFQKGQANVIKIGTGSNPTTPMPNASFSPTSSTSPANPFDDSASASNFSRHSRVDSQETVTGGSVDSSRRPESASSRWTASSLASDTSDAVQFLQGQSITFTNHNSSSPNTPNPHASPRLPNTASTATAFDVPRSARSSEAFDTGERSRPLTGGSASAWSSSSASMSRSSTASGTSDASHMSLLEGIPFMAPPLPNGPSSSSISLGLPINVTAPLDGPSASMNNPPTFPLPPPRAPSPNASVVSTSSATISPVIPFTQPPAPSAPASSAFSAENLADGDDDEPLPAPFLPFAGQRPTSTASNSSGAFPSAAGGQGERVQSEAFSVRSGFGSGLSQIPFQLGFPSGFGEDDTGMSERGSMITTGSRDSRFSGMEGEHAQESEDDQGKLSGVEEMTEPASSVQSRRESAASLKMPAPSAPPAPSAVGALPSPAPSPTSEPTSAATAAEDDAANPFGSHAEVDGSDPRASMDTLALSAALSANLDAEG
ncbi:hypothetical protein JCM5296_004562 [Sporobolomyces johnsonii]